MAGQQKTGRRKVSNLMALSLLSLLTERPMYPYEMASKLREYGKDQAIKINWGSLYTVVQNLEKHGFIEAVEVAREGRQPERTTYRITEAGRDRAEGLAARAAQRARAGVHQVRGGARGVRHPGARRADRPAAAAAGRAGRGQRRASGRAGRDEAQLPRLFLIESEYQLALRRAEAEWVRGLLTELTDGTFPGLEAWRHFHETGEFPEEFSRP